MASVPPTVANAIANQQLDDAYNDGHAGNANIQVARASKRLKRAHSIDRLITEEELGQQEAFFVQEIAHAFPTADPPAWFGPAVNAAVDAAVGPAVKAAVDAAVTPIEARLNNIEARLHNANAVDSPDSLRSIRNATGAEYPTFPATLAELHQLTPAQKREMLEFYGLSTTPVETQGRRLSHHLGLRN